MDFTKDEKYDNILLDIIQNANSLPNFFDLLFGFLRRRTDLFYIMDNDQQTMGFPPGKAEYLILNVFKKHKEIFERPNTSNPDKLDKPNFKPTPRINNINTTENQNVKSISSGSVIKNSSADSNEVVYVADAESYNGAVRDNYTWSQTIGELDVRVKVPETVCNSKEIQVKVDKKQLTVSHNCTQNNDETTLVHIVNGNLCWEVKKNDIFWSFDRKDHKILITMEKVLERWWDALFVGEETINTRQIDCSRPMSDLDEEAQAKIYKLMFDNQQKQLGLPTSDEQKMNDTLRAAWNTDGSPFKGTNFDVSMIDHN